MRVTPTDDQELLREAVRGAFADVVRGRDQPACVADAVALFRVLSGTTARRPGDPTTTGGPP